MSHITKLKTEFNNTKHLKAAVEIVAKNNNFGTFENKTVQDWQGEVRNDQKAITGVVHDDIRVAGYIPNEEGGYNLESDFYNTEIRESEFNLQIQREYTREMAGELAAEKGYTMLGSDLEEDGTYRITLSR